MGHYSSEAIFDRSVYTVLRICNFINLRITELLMYRPV